MKVALRCINFSKFSNFLSIFKIFFARFLLKILWVHTCSAAGTYGVVGVQLVCLARRAVVSRVGTGKAGWMALETGW